MITLNQIDNSYTLFIDRDGVINKEKKLDYILNWNEFTFNDGVLEAMEILAKKFHLIIIVTNQKGIGKGIMSVEDLQNIHQNMVSVIGKNGGRIDKIYYCSDLDNESPNRKPNAGMALQAMRDFSSIDKNKSLMIGNKLSDMFFARNAGITSVFVDTTNPETPNPHEAIDYRFDDLISFAKTLTKS